MTEPEFMKYSLEQWEGGGGPCIIYNICISMLDGGQLLSSLRQQRSRSNLNLPDWKDRPTHRWLCLLTPAGCVSRFTVQTAAQRSNQPFGSLLPPDGRAHVGNNQDGKKIMTKNVQATPEPKIRNIYNIFRFKSVHILCKTVD